MKPLYPVVAGDLRNQRARRRSDAVVAVIDQLERRLFLSGTLTPIASFNGVDGANPTAVVQGSSGNLFGITEFTYASVNALPGPGVFFEIPANTGTINDLNVVSTNGSPVGLSDLIIDSSDNLYGVASIGTANAPQAVVELPAGTTTAKTLGTFAADETGQLTAVDSAGDLFGIGGTSDGTFEVVKNSGMITPLADVNDQLQQTIPDLQLGPDGNLYGVSYGAATTEADLFEITPSNGNLQILAAFDPTTSGDTPIGLTFDSSGNIWGFCQQGGPNGDGTYGSGSGTVWEFPLPVTSANPTISLITQITSNVGRNITCRPAFGTSGNLYGITEDGGANGNGTIFDLPAGGATLTDLYDWSAGAADPDLPEGLITNSSGVAPDTATTATTTFTAEGALSVKQTTPAVATATSPNARVFTSNDITAVEGESPDGNGIILEITGDQGNLSFIRPPTYSQSLKTLQDGFEKALDKLEQAGNNQAAIAAAVWTGVLGSTQQIVALADTQVGMDASLISQLVPITQLLAQTKKEIRSADQFLSKFTGVDNKYTKEGTTITALDAQLSAQTNPGKQAAIEKKITADEAVQASLLTQDDGDSTAMGNDVDGIITLETNIDTALAALPIPFSELTAAVTSVPALINPGKKATAVVTVTNSGNVPVTLSFQMVLSARPQGTTGSADVTLATDTIKLHRLKPNVPASERLSFLIPKTFAAGTYSLVATPVLSATLTGVATPVVSTVTFTVP